MKATSIKQIKFNRGQVTDLLSERVDMGLQNACGTVYDNMYINRYGQLQNAPSLLLAADSLLGVNETLVCMFDTGEDYVYPVTIKYNTPNMTLCVYSALSKSNPYEKTDLSTPIASQVIPAANYEKTLQFGYNILFYGQKTKPWLINILPSGAAWLPSAVTLTVKTDYFNGAFNQIFIRGLNIGTPTGFTVPTSGYYKIVGQTSVTTSVVVKVNRNGAGGNFTQALVGQVIDSPANGGSLQVRSVEGNDSLTAYVLSPLISLTSGTTDIEIPWYTSGNYESAKWIFGYENPYGDTASPSGTASYPDSAIFVNQRLVFGGNDYHGNIISASRVGVINDFDPESGTESDAFTTAISSKDLCRIVDFVLSNNELRIACTNGEYAMSLDNLTPTASLKGFDLRSEVGMSKGTKICDCGGITAYTSQDKNAIYATQFSLLRDRYQPISLTSQTSNIIDLCTQLVYLTNRPNSEGNCLVGRNVDGTMFGLGVDTNAGLIGAYKINNNLGTINYIFNIYNVGSALWATFRTDTGFFLTRFVFGEIFNLPTWYESIGGGKITITYPIYMLATSATDYKYRALYYNAEKDEYEIIKPTSYTDNGDGTYDVKFAPEIQRWNIVCVGFARQSDWRSVEIGMGMATRELNKRIVKLEGVIEPTQLTGKGNFKGRILTHEQAKKFITLTRSKDVQTMDIDNLSSTSYTENADLVWRRAFDNPDRELHYGVSFVAPFLVKSLTATVEYDEVQ